MNGDCLTIATKDEYLQNQIETIAESRGFECQSAELATGQPSAEGRHILAADLRDPASWCDLPPRIARLRSSSRAPYVIGLVDGAVPFDQCLNAQQQLDDILCLPAGPDRIEEALGRVGTAAGDARAAHPELRELVGGGERLVTRTPALFSLFEHVDMIAKRDLSVLLVGETGTGKTTLARIIHGISPRRDRNFTNVACGTLQTELIDSALFGHVRGAFTGADSTKEGKFAVAKDGTILLDEIDILGLHQQARLLRVLETGQYESLGSNDTHTTNARVIVATNEPLKPLMEKGQFRPDLYFRLNQVTLELPPLRNRPLDIVPLALQFIEDSCQKNQMKITGIHPEFLSSLEAYSWPGNVRELRNEVTRAVLFARNGVIDPQTLSNTIKQDRKTQDTNGSPYGLAGEVASTEQSAIERMLKVHQYNRTATAKALGISRVTLYNKIRRYRIEVDTLRAMNNDADIC